MNLQTTSSFEMVHSSSLNATLSCSIRSTSSSRSCLSAQLGNAPAQQARETFPVLSPAKSFYISPEDEDKVLCESPDQYSEPPISVHNGSMLSQQDSQEFPLGNCFIRLDTRRSGRISPLANSNLDPSPLTDSSPQVMGREYDRDTWRMYERIQTARSSTSSRSGGGTLSASKEGGHCLSTIQSDGDDSSCSSISEHLYAVAIEDHNESEAMFELDL
jgi:hypothetical protein